MPKTKYPNPLLYSFFRFFSFVLVVTILFLLGVIYLLVNKNILPSFKLAHKKLEGKIAYLNTENQISIYDGTNGKVLTTSLRQTSSPGKKPLWSPDGKKIIANTVSGNNYQYYDTGRKVAFSIQMPFTGQVEVAGWADDNTLLVSDYLNLYTINLRGQNKKQICTECTYAAYDGKGINRRGHQIVVLKQNHAPEGSQAPSDIPYIINLDTLTQREIGVVAADTILDSYDYGSFTFDTSGNKLAFSFSAYLKGDETKDSLTKRMGYFDVVSGGFTSIRPDEIKTFLNSLANSKIGVFGYPQFSPDGKTLSFFGFLGSDSTYYLVRTDLDGKNAETISPVAADFGGQSWSPDSMWLVFTDQKGSLRAASRDGKNSYFLLDSAFQPTWSPVFP